MLFDDSLSEFVCTCSMFVMHHCLLVKVAQISSASEVLFFVYVYFVLDFYFVHESGLAGEATVAN